MAISNKDNKKQEWILVKGIIQPQDEAIVVDIPKLADIENE
jgi:hypothetical protein